jgi:dihydrofolate reductase
MAKIIASHFISLDGVVQAPGMPEEDTDGGFRHGGWSGRYFDTEFVGGLWGDVARQCDALLEGRRTWQVSAGAWPNQTDDPFADWINRVQKYVVSDTLSDADLTWKPTTIIRGADLLHEASALRGRAGGDVMVLGSPSVVRALMAADLIDELAIMIEPIVLGGGKSIFPDNGEALGFELTSVKTSPKGVQVCRYQRARD